jgi:uncharacterized membrane protein (DUF485 family)
MKNKKGSHMKPREREDWQGLLARKKQFVFRMVAVFICFYFTLPAGIILFPSFMAHRVVSHFTVAWLIALLQFVMVWAMGMIYYIKTVNFDRLIEKIVAQAYRIRGIEK